MMNNRLARTRYIYSDYEEFKGFWSRIERFLFVPFQPSWCLFHNSTETFFLSTSVKEWELLSRIMKFVFSVLKMNVLFSEHYLWKNILSQKLFYFGTRIVFKQSENSNNCTCLIYPIFSVLNYKLTDSSKVICGWFLKIIGSWFLCQEKEYPNSYYITSDIPLNTFEWKKFWTVIEPEQ